MRLGLALGDGGRALGLALGVLVQEAPHLVAAHVHKVGDLLAADVHAGVAPVGEVAARGHLQRVRHHALDHVQALRVVVLQAGDGLQQAQRVGMHRVVEQRAHLGFLHHLAAVHDHHAVGRLGHHAQVVRDQQHGHAGVVAQAAQQVQDLRLDGHVEGRGGLVGDEQLRVARQRHGYHDALAHAARHLVRVVVDALLGARDAHLAQHVDGALARLLLRHVLVRADGLHDLLAHAVHRVERRHGLLEDHGHVVAAQLAVLAFGQRHQVLALELHRAAGHVPRLGQKAHDREAGHGLAGARLAHDGQDLAGVHVEAHVLDGLDDALLDGKLRGEVLHR